MKLKRFLAFIVSLSMVLSVVPAFSLTASASSVTDIIDATPGATVVWSMPDTTGWADSDISEIEGWSATVNSGYANLVSSTDGNYIQIYGETSDVTITTPGYGADTDGVIIEWKFKRSGTDSTFYQKHAFFDVNGVEIGHAWLDKNHTDPIEENPLGFPDDGAKLALVAINNDDGTTHTNQWYLNGELVYTQSSVTGKISGIKTITAGGGNSTSWRHMGFRSLTFASYTKPESTKTITATYTVDGATVKEISKTIDTSVATEASFNEYYYRANGTNTLYKADAQNLSDSAAIEMTLLDNWGNYAIDASVVADNMPYIIKSGNLAPNGNFEYGMNGWYARNNSTPPTTYSVTTTDKPTNAERAALSTGAGGNASANSIKQAWDITVGDTYYYSMWVKASDEWHGLGQSDDTTTESLDIIGNGGFGTAGTWVQKTGAFTATKEYLVFFEGWGSVGLADVELYKAELDSANVAKTTVKFVDSANTETELATAKEVECVIDGTIDLTDTSVVPEVINYDGNVYTKDETNAASFTATESENTVTITYTLDPVINFTGTPVTVIEGNDPILSTLVTGVTGKGSEMELSGAVWNDAAGLTAGTHTVNGTITVNGETVNGTVEVTVLPASFTLADVVSVNGQTAADNALTMFPRALGDEFTIEFTANYASFGDLWITLKNSAQKEFFGPEQIPLGVNSSGAFRPVNGDGAGSRAEADFDHVTFTTGTNYRFFITTDASTDKYSVKVTDEATGEVVDEFENYGYRTNADSINCIVALTNNGAGSVTLTNIKVHSKAVNPATVTLEYTTEDGTVVGTYTHSGYTGDSVDFPAGVYTDANGTQYDVEAVTVAITEAAHTVAVNAVKLEEVTVNYLYNEEIVKTKTFYAAAGATVSYHAFTIATADAVYSAPAFAATVDATSLTHPVVVTVMDSTVMATDTLTYNATTGATMPYPTDRAEALAGKEDAMLSVSWNDDRYGEMKFANVTTAEGEAIATATLYMTPGDIMGGQENTFNIYAVPVSSYGAAVDFTAAALVGSGTFTAVDVPVAVTLDLSDYDASEGVMLVYDVTGGLIGVYGTSFTEAPVLTYEVRTKATATFNYVCEGTQVSTVTKDGYVGDTMSVTAGYIEVDGTKYYVDAASVLLTTGENTAEVNARKIESVTINYTLSGEVKKTVTLEGFAGDAVIAPDVYINVDKAVYHSEAKEYTLVEGGSSFDVELELAPGATYASTTETYNYTTKTVMLYPEGADRYEPFFNTDAFLSANWGDDRYGEILFDVTVPEGDVINSAQLTLTPGDIMAGNYTNTFNIYAADPDTYGTANDITSLTVVGSGRFTETNVPVTVDLDLTKYEEYEDTGKVLLLYDVTGGLIGVYGASFGDAAPRLSYTTGELGARVDVSDEFVVEYAKGTLADFDAVNPPVTLTDSGYLATDEAWEGFSETNSEGISHIDVYAASVNEPIIRVVSELSAGAGETEELAPSTVTTPGYGAGSEYVLFSFNPEIGTALWTDIGLIDNDGKLITAFRLNNDDTDTICPIWGHIGWATPFRSEFESMEYSFNPAGEAKATITDLVSQVDVLMRNFDPDGVADSGDEYYTAAFMVDGNVFTVGTYSGNFNGLKDIEMACAGSTTDQYGGIAAVKIYSGNEPRVIGSITANYIYNGEVVHSVTKYYDKSTVEEGSIVGLEFDEFYYSALGEYPLYRVPECVLSTNTDIEVVQYHPTTNVVTTLIHNWSHDDLTPGDLYTNAETAKTYSIATRNLIANGNFEHGVAAWYDGELGELSEVEFVPNPDNETVIIRADGTTTSEYGLYNAWALEKGETYLFTYTATGLNDTYAGITQTDVIDPVSYDPTLSTKLQEGKNYIVFDAESDYLKLNIGWSKNAEVGSFGLYKLDIIEMSDIYRTIIEGSDPVLPKYVSTYEEGIVDRVVWRAEDLANLQIGENTVTGDLYTEITYAEEITEDATGEATEGSTDVAEDEEYIIDGDKVLVPIGETVTATVMVYPETFTHPTINSYNGQSDVINNGGNQRLAQDVTGKFVVEMDVTVQAYGDMWIILNDSAKTSDTAFFGPDQILVGPSYFGGEIMPQNGYGDGTREANTTLMIAGRNKPYRFLIMGDTNSDTYSVTVVSPEGVAKTFEDYGFRTNADKIDSIAMFTNSDGTGTFTAENIKVYDLDPIDVNYVLQKSGEADRALTTEELGEYFYGEEVTLPEGKFYLSYYDETLPVYGEEASTDDNVAHIVKTTEEQTFVVTPEHSTTPHTVYVQLHKENAVLYDTYATGNADELNVAENLLFAGSSGVSNAPDVDDDGAATTTGNGYVGAPRIPLLTFNIPEFNEGEVVMLNLYAYQANQNLGIDKTMKLAANAVDFEVDENTVYSPDEVASLESLIWSDSAVTQTDETLSEGRYTVKDGTRRVAIDVTDLIVKAQAEGKDRITFAVYAPLAGAYLMNREATTYGAIHQGDYAAFLEVENDTLTATVYDASLVTKNGSAVQLVENGAATVYIRNDATMRMYTEDATHVVFAETESGKVYDIKTEDGVRRTTLTGDLITDNGIYVPYALGVDMVDGAQVRIGDGVDENGEFIGGSGLRFISVVNATDTLAGMALENSAMEMGVKVTAEGSTAEVYIPAEKWQNDGAVFTSALTNLAVSNYNRNFTAVPYIKCTDAADGTELEYTNASVTRSIYKVAAGLLTKGYNKDDDSNGVITDGDYADKDGNETDYSSMPQILVDVLNAYVNQTGVRLTLSDNSETATLTARTEGSGAYTGEAFFTVGETTYADGKYTVTLTAVGQSKIDVNIFNKYVRINNNNSKVAPVTTITDNGDNTYTLVFDYSNM